MSCEFASPISPTSVLLLMLTPLMPLRSRGKRITYDLPLSALLSSPSSPTASPSDNPFASTTPRLLFPPPTPVTPPSSGESSFLATLRASAPVSPKKRPFPEEDDEHGLPTPVQESRKKNRVDEWTRNLVR